MKFTALTTAMPPGGWLSKFLLVMKLTTLLIMIALVHASAEGYAQRISLSAHNTPIEKVLLAIEKQAGYVFIYDQDELQHTTISVSIKDASIEEALSACFKNTSFRFRIVEKNIVISIKEEGAVSDQVQPRAVRKKISGTVLEDSTGVTLAGAQVQITALAAPANQLPGAINGAITISDSEGRFYATVDPGKYSISVSYIGFEDYRKEIDVEGDLYLDIKMRSSITMLGDITINVMNTGYQKISAERATGVFNTIEKNQIEKPSINIAERLMGTTAGMDVKMDVNGTPSIQVRGQSTLFGSNNGNAGFQGDNNPLVIVDGFPVKGVFQNAFGGVNPNDIETITVLKDAAAASIWGARSSNGVIVITTKSANKDARLKVDFSVFTRFSKKADVGYLTGNASAAASVDFEKLAFGHWGKFSHLRSGV